MSMLTVLLLFFAFLTASAPLSAVARRDPLFVARCGNRILNDDAACCNIIVRMNGQSLTGSIPVSDTHPVDKKSPAYRPYPFIGYRRLVMLTGKLGLFMSEEGILVMHILSHLRFPERVASRIYRRRFVMLSNVRFWTQCVPISFCQDIHASTESTVCRVVFRAHVGYISVNSLLALYRNLCSLTHNGPNSCVRDLIEAHRRLTATASYEVNKLLRRFWLVRHPVPKSLRKASLNPRCYGGVQMITATGLQLRQYLAAGCAVPHAAERYVFERLDNLPSDIVDTDVVYCRMSLRTLSSFAPMTKLRAAMKQHDIPTEPYQPLPVLLAGSLSQHQCPKCDELYCLFRSLASKDPTVSSEKKKWKLDSSVSFPPTKLSDSRKLKIIRSACAEFDVRNIEESGCSVCGRLTLQSKLASLRTVKENLSVLAVDGLARLPRNNANDPLHYRRGPVLANQKNVGCPTCIKALQQGTLPSNALASGLWLGDVPSELSSLTFAEKLLVSRIQRNVCVARVTSGG